MSLLTNCKPKFKSCPIGKIPTDAVAWFFKIRDVNRCNIYGFKNSYARNGSVLYSHNYGDKPDEKVCGLDKCDMTGTLFVTPDTAPTNPVTKDATTDVTVTTEVKANGEDFQYGYLRLFIYSMAHPAQEFEITITNSGSSDQGVNKYKVKPGSGWQPVLLELFNPDEVVDGGWVATNSSIVVTVSTAGTDPFRLSTIELFDDIYSLVRDQTIGFQCVSDFSGDPSLTLTEDLCASSEYDETATAIERSITASNIIGELADFHNTTKRQKNLEHIVTTQDTFKAVSVIAPNGTEYASFNIPELADISCPRLLVQPADCRFKSLYHLNTDNDETFIDITDEHFFRKFNTVYLDKAYIGTEITVAYPIWVEGTAWDITSEDLNKQHYQMEMTVPICDDEYIIKADNVFLTALPFTWTNAAGSFTVPYTMKQDTYGKYGSIVKIDSRK